MHGLFHHSQHLNRLHEGRMLSKRTFVFGQIKREDRRILDRVRKDSRDTRLEGVL